MAGLLQQGMAEQRPSPQAQQQPARPPQQMQQGAPSQEAPTQDGAPMDESHPAFEAAVQLAHTALYEQGSADSINQILVSTEDPVSQMADIAYEMTSIADERTEGAVPDELLILLAANMLNEVADIATASGVELRPADLANAMKQMILRFVGEMGHDTRQLQAAMDEIPPEEFDRMTGGAAPAAQQPPMQESAMQGGA
ncbi:MAG: hypothetical protein CME80_08520 [Halomonas sp.]|nr:hypothetical protein [Halomonas sp.]MBF57748.1 hypothetical protein [Halomonas sp.]|tara:strand:+ start:39428 stop:40021 length:594 start_codon:yes stop_codon:yes gene_type:complete